MDGRPWRCTVLVDSLGGHLLAGFPSAFGAGFSVGLAGFIRDAHFACIASDLGGAHVGTFSWAALVHTFQLLRLADRSGGALPATRGSLLVAGLGSSLPMNGTARLVGGFGVARSA